MFHVSLIVVVVPEVKVKVVGETPFASVEKKLLP